MDYSDVIKYWFSEKSREHWFFSTPEIDNEIKQRYEQLWINAASGELDDWQDSPQGCLALIIVLDQFPLNMFRGKAKSFQTEEMAVEVALRAIDKGYDEIFGARELSRIIQHEIKKPMAEELIFGKISKGGHISVTLKKNKIFFNFSKKESLKKILV